MVIDRDLRVPFEVGALHVARLHLRGDHVVAVEIEAVAVVAAEDRPRLAVLCGERFGVAGRDRVVPRHEPLVAVRVLADVDEDDGVAQRFERRRLVRRGELVEHLHHRLERGRLVAVDRVGQPDDEGRARRDSPRLLRRCRARVCEAAHRGFDLVDAAQILRRGDGDDVLRPPLVRLADVIDPHAIRGGDRDALQPPLHRRVFRVEVAHIELRQGLRARHRFAVGAARVEVETRLVALGAGGGRGERETECGEGEGACDLCHRVGPAFRISVDCVKDSRY